MKKFLLVVFSALLSYSAMSAKELTFYYGNQTVAANATVEFSTYESFDWGTQTEIFFEPKIYISKDTAEPVTIKTSANYPVQVCIGGQCEAAEEILKEGLQFAANTKTDLLLDCSIFFDKNQEIDIPAIVVEIEAWYTSEPNNITKMTLEMGKTAAVYDIVSDHNTVAVVNKTLNYNVDGASNITVFNLSGQSVTSHKVQGAGSISLDSLPTGIYMYRVDGAVRSTGKFINR